MRRQGTATVVPFERPAGALESTPDRPSEAVEATAPRPIALPPVEVPRARRPGWPTLAALAIVSGLAAVGLGAWSVLAEARSEPSAEEDAAVAQSLAVLADSSARRYPFRGALGRIALVVTDTGAAVVALDGLGPAPTGSAYRVWLVRPGSATPVADVAFDGASRAVRLERRIPVGARVAVTLEPSGDATRPSRPLRLFAVRE